MEIIIDFKRITSYKELFIYLDEKLNLSELIEGGWGENLYAFWDTYSYRKDNDFFILKNTKSVTDPKMLNTIKVFIETLDNLKGVDSTHTPNPNFDYMIES